MPEVWADVPGYEGLYQVSDQGRVKRLARTSCIGRNLPEKDMKPQVRPDGYAQVVFRVDHRVSTHKVHRLVCQAFRGDAPEGHEVRHLNGERLDNRVENLVYGTRSENMRDAVGHGTHHWASRTHCPRGHELSGANLRPDHARKGRRSCLTCNRVRVRCRNRGVEPTDKMFSDTYASIIGTTDRNKEKVS